MWPMVSFFLVFFFLGRGRGRTDGVDRFDPLDHQTLFGPPRTERIESASDLSIQRRWLIWSWEYVCNRLLDSLVALLR